MASFRTDVQVLTACVAIDLNKLPAAKQWLKTTPAAQRMAGCAATRKSMQPERQPGLHCARALPALAASGGADGSKRPPRWYRNT